MSDQEKRPQDTEQNEHVENGQDQPLSAWRLLLQQAIAEPEERRRIAEYLHVNAATLARWSHGTSNPHPSSLQALVDVLPFPRRQIIAAIQQEYPELAFHTISAYAIPQDIPNWFYTHILDAHNQLPASIHSERMLSLILRQLLLHFDPLEECMAAYVAQCTPPRSGQKVRSLYITYGVGSLSCPHIEHSHYFLGAESQTGNALQSQRSIVMPDYAIAMQHYPSHRQKGIESAISYPLSHRGEVAGCLIVISTRPHSFSLAHMELVRQYANLLVLAFEREQFYRLEQVALGLIPPASCQEPYIMPLRRKMVQRIIQAARDQRTLPQKEALVQAWQEVEEILLHFPDMHT